MKWEFQKQMKFPFLFSRDCKGEFFWYCQQKPIFLYWMVKKNINFYCSPPKCSPWLDSCLVAEATAAEWAETAGGVRADFSKVRKVLSDGDGLNKCVVHGTKETRGLARTRLRTRNPPCTKSGGCVQRVEASGCRPRPVTLTRRPPRPLHCPPRNTPSEAGKMRISCRKWPKSTKNGLPEHR